MGFGREVLAVCSNKTGSGITVWDLESGDRVLHISSCSSPRHGFLCLRNQFLVASQIPRQDSVGGGAVFFWPLHKPQSPLRSYPMETIGPLSGTRSGAYLAGGAASGNGYLWEVGSGKLLKTWRAHHKSLCCIVFSHDDSLLISGSDDGTVCVWSLISLLDMADKGSSPSLLHYSSEHRSSITGLSTSGSTSSIFASSSIDGTCKIWDIISGRLLRNQVYPSAITAIGLHPVERLLITGNEDGLMAVNTVDIQLLEDSCILSEGQPVLLKGHNESITAITFSGLSLISSSADCTICIWDVSDWTVIRRFNHAKGPVTNLVVMPRSSLHSVRNYHRLSNQLGISVLDKYPQPANSVSRMTASYFSCHSLKDNEPSNDFQSSSLLTRQILDLKQDWTPAAMQMKVEINMENQMWAMRIAKHVMQMNKHLQTRLLDLMECRISWLTEKDSSTNRRKKKKLKVETPPLKGLERQSLV